MIPPDPGSADPTRSPQAADIPDAAESDDGVTPTDPPTPPPPARPGAGTFTIEGRSAPGLFVVGWLGTLVGLVAVAVALLAGGSPAAAILLLVGLVVLSIGLVALAGAQGIERRVRGGRPYAGPSPVLVFAASVPVSLVAVFLVGIPLTVTGVPVDGPIGRLASVAVQALVYIGLIKLLVVDTGALSWAQMGIKRFDGRALAELATGALWAAPVILATVVVAGVLIQLIPVTPVSPLPPTGQAVGLAIHLAAGVVIAPIGEEVLFRGFATTAWSRSLGPRRGLVLAALFFALVHVLTIGGSTAGEALGQAVVGFGSRIPVALALGWLFLRRGTIWAPLGLHAAFNAVLLVISEIAAGSGVVPA